MDEKEFLKLLGENIVRYREIIGLKQIDLAVKLNMEDSSLRRIEKGRTNPTVLMLRRIADSLDVTVNELLP